jgi:hypothetical protein
VPVERDHVFDAAAVPDLLAPVGRVTGQVVFRWDPAAGGNLYRITVFDEDGLTVWETETGETTVRLPAGIQLMSGAQYLWMVSARIQTGRWVPSDLARFTVSES